MKIFSTLLLFILSISMVCAQQDGMSLSKKWANMLENAETYEPYKVIKKAELQDFEKNMSDSIRTYQKATKAEKNTVAQQATEIAVLKTNLEQVNDSLEQISKEKDAISFLGISANKYGYMSVLLLIILGCVALIVMLFSMYKKSQVVAVQKVDAYKKIEQECGEYKQAKFETEKKLKREMQTLLNELEELRRR